MSLATWRNLSVFAITLLVLGCCALAGCSGGSSSSASGSASSSSANSEASSSASEKNVLVLGEKTDTAQNVVFTNNSGAAITNFALQAAGAAEQPDFLMKDGEQVANGEQVSVYAEVAEGSLLDAIVVCGDKQYALHGLNFGVIDDATIRVDEDTAYIETTIDGNVVSTLREEYDRAHPVAEEQQAAAEQDAAPEEAPAAESVEQAASEPVFYEEPAAEAQEAPAQSEDACVSDVVLR